MKKQLTLFYRLFVELFFFGGLSEIQLIKQSLSNLKKLILFRLDPEYQSYGSPS